jgi:hypothetical protein
MRSLLVLAGVSILAICATVHFAREARSARAEAKVDADEIMARHQRIEEVIEARTATFADRQKLATEVTKRELIADPAEVEEIVAEYMPRERVRMEAEEQLVELDDARQSCQERADQAWTAALSAASVAVVGSLAIGLWGTWLWTRRGTPARK